MPLHQNASPSYYNIITSTLGLYYTRRGGLYIIIEGIKIQNSLENLYAFRNSSINYY